MSRIVIFANGELPDLNIARGLIRADDFFIAADGGTRHALALGLTPNVIIGDLDSLTIGFVPPEGTGVIQYSSDKNETDLELALQYALALNPSQVIVIAGVGGRLDQTLANISLLSNERFAALDIRMDDGVEELFFCRDRAQIHGRSGDLVSLLPWGEPVDGIRTHNLKWPLENETLFPQKTRGVSNEMTSQQANISIESGLLLIVHRRLISTSD